MANETILNFVNGMGASSSPEEKCSIGFEKSIQQSIWERLIGEIGVGYFQNGFFYLFGEQLTRLSPILHHWNFLLDQNVEYTLLGMNKMAFLILGEDLHRRGMASQISIVDPFHVTLQRNPQIKLLNFVGRWLPDGMIPYLNDSRIYEAFSSATDSPLHFEEIIAMKTPLSLGGSFQADNFTVEPILSYFQSTGEIYSKNLEGRS